MKKYSVLGIVAAILLMMVFTGCGQTKQTDLSYKPTEEEKAATAALGGTWQVDTPTETGTSVVKIEIDSSNGFTFTTGTVNADGTAGYYSYVGQDQITPASSAITFMSTSGGESTDGTNYTLKEDIKSFNYTYALSEDGSQMTLTPADDAAVAITGANPITLTKTA